MGVEELKMTNTILLRSSPANGEPKTGTVASGCNGGKRSLKKLGSGLVEWLKW
jgi:hypothetical protein